MKKVLMFSIKLILDLTLFIFSIFLSFYLRFDGKIPIFYLRMFLITLPLEIILIIIFFNFLKIFKTLWEYVSVKELINLVYAIIVEKSLFAFITYILRDNKILQNLLNKSSSINYPRSVLLMSIFLSIVFLGSIRLIWRIFNEKKNVKINFANDNKINLLIIGVGHTGVSILRDLKRNNLGNYKIIGFLDDDPMKLGMYIDNIRVIGKINDLKNIINKYNIKEIIIAIPNASSELLKKIIDQIPGRINLKIVTNFYEIEEERYKQSKIRPLKLEDLLQREPVYIDIEKIKQFTENKKILITGAAGSIGSELARQISKLNNSFLILIDINESELYMLYQELSNKVNNDNIKIIICDIRDKNNLEKIINFYKPNIIFHSAAYKHVPLMEEFRDEAIKTNILGTLNLVKFVDLYKVEKFIYISTDKAVKPVSIMGATKRIGELIVDYYSKNSKTKFMIVRFGNVLGSSGSVIPIFIKQIEKGGPITVTHPEMERYFMTINEAVRLILQASAMGNGGEIFVLDMGKPVKIIDIAKNLIKIYGYEPEKDIKIVFSGLRPGEKIKEELFYENEELNLSSNPKIFVVKNNIPNLINIDEVEKNPYIYIEKVLYKN
ncbi:MAG: polysaccharide biosynthesis protein [Caldisericia bacterium]